MSRYTDVYSLGSCLVGGEVLDSLVGDHVELGVNPFSLLVDNLQSVSVVSVHESPSCWNSPI